LQGGRTTFGPKAAETAGRMYRDLWDHNFFVARSSGATPAPDLEKVLNVPAPKQQ